MYKNNPFKFLKEGVKFVKKVVLSVVSLTAIFTLFSGCTKDEDEKKVATEESSMVVGSHDKKSTKESKVQEKSDEKNISFDEKIKTMTESLNMGLSNFYDVEFSEKEKTFKLISKNDGPVNENLKKIAGEDLNDENKKSIEELATSLVGFSEAVKDSLGKGYKIEVINQFNNKGSFFILEDGKISYPINK